MIGMPLPMLRRLAGVEKTHFPAVLQELDHVWLWLLASDVLGGAGWPVGDRHWPVFVGFGDDRGRLGERYGYSGQNYSGSNSSDSLRLPGQHPL